MTKDEGFIPIEDGLRLYYQTLGDGEDALVIPLACTLLEDLHPLAEKRRLIFYDPRGRGRSDRDMVKGRIWSDYQVRDQETVRQFFGLVFVGWNSRVICCPTSLKRQPPDPDVPGLSSQSGAL